MTNSDENREQLQGKEEQKMGSRCAEKRRIEKEIEEFRMK